MLIRSQEKLYIIAAKPIGPSSFLGSGADTRLRGLAENVREQGSVTKPVKK